MMDVRQTEEYGRYLLSLGWIVEASRQGHKAFIRKMPIFPVSIMKLQRVDVTKLDWAWVQRLVKKYRVVKTYLEANCTSDQNSVVNEVDEALGEHGFKPAKGLGMLPTKTSVIDLRQTENKLLEAMKPKTRYNLHLAQRKGLTVETLTGEEVVKDEVMMAKLYSLLAANAKGQRFYGVGLKELKALLEAFGEKAVVVKVEKGGELVAATVFLASPDTLFYSHNGSSELGRKVMAPTLAVWEGMKWGKQRGLHWLDFDGIEDERFPWPRWRGFSRFKLGFGGRQQYFSPLYQQSWNWIKPKRNKASNTA